MAQASRAIRTILPDVFAFLLAAPLVFGAEPGAAKTLWSIYAFTDWMPCGDGVLLTPAAPGETMPGIKPCLRNHSYYPFENCQPITIIGYDIVHEVTDQNTSSVMIVGSGYAGPGSDVFAMTGGRGTTSSRMMFPPGVGLPQGGINEKPEGAHIDIYGSCPGSPGKQRGIVTLYYTSP